VDWTPVIRQVSTTAIIRIAGIAILIRTAIIADTALGTPMVTTIKENVIVL
jgi:hypothetical protein